MQPNPPTPILSVRVSQSERELLQMAAEQARTTLSDFIRRKALEAAEIDVLNYHNAIIPAEDWEKFEAWVATPAKNIPALRELAAIKPAWQE